MICSIAGNFEAGNSLNLAVTAVVGQHLRVIVHCYSRANGTTLLDVTCCVHLHTLSSCCCALLGVVAQSLKSVKLLARECWVRLHVAVDFSMLLAERFWQETVSLLDVR